MSHKRAGDRAAFFLLAVAIGAAAALLIVPTSGARTRRRLSRQGEELADYLIDAGKELVDKCEEDATTLPLQAESSDERTSSMSSEANNRARNSTTGSKPKRRFFGPKGMPA